MQWDYVYADLQLQVTFDADGSSPFGNLTDTEVNALQQLVYHGLMIFQNIRTLYVKDAIMKGIEEGKKRNPETKQEQGG